MTKIVYNDSYGGFGLSRVAIIRARELSNDPNWGGPCIIGDVYADNAPVKYDYGHCDSVSRTDSILVQVVEELGNLANGLHAKLKIADVPTGTKYRIDEYDGWESVMTIDDYDWQIA